MKTSLGRALALAALIATGSAAAAEEWWQAYERGVSAVKAGQYKEAVPALQRALARRHMESATIRLDDRTLIYLPHFWLGVARYHLGEGDEAMREWKISQEQGAIQQTPSYAELRDRISLAQAPKTATTSRGETKQSASSAVRAAASAQVSALAAGGDKGEAYAAGSRKLQEALDAAADGTSDPRHYGRAVDLARQAGSYFSKAEADAKRQRGNSRSLDEGTAPVVSARQAEVIVGVQHYRRRLVAARDKRGVTAAFRDYLQRQSALAARWQKQLSTSLDEAGIGDISRQVEQKERELDERTAKLTVPGGSGASAGEVTDARSRAIESAFRAYGRGDFEAAEKMLTSVLASGPAADAFLLRGCARYTKGILSASQALLDDAASDFDAALRLDRDVRLEPAAFSPKLVGFFERVRTGGP